MKNSDEVVDRLLKGLRTAQAPSGMESRILNAMESRTAPRNNWLLYATATACLSLAAMWFIAIIRVPQPPLMPMYNPSLTATQIPASPIATKSKVRAVKQVPPDPAQLASFPAPPLATHRSGKVITPPGAPTGRKQHGRPQPRSARRANSQSQRTVPEILRHRRPRNEEAE